MDIQGRSTVVTNAISILSADVFFHPFWLHFPVVNPADAAQLTGTLVREVKLLADSGLWLDSCRAAMICAYLQNLCGRSNSALETLHDAQILARRHNLANVNLWAAWGESAICAQEGEYEQAAQYLQQLEQDLYHRNKWILADLISLVRGTMLEWQVQARRTSLLPLAIHQDEVGLLIEYMLRWGKPWLEAPQKTSQIWNTLQKQNGGYALGGLRGLWGTFLRVLRGEMRLKLVYEEQMDHSALETNPPCNDKQFPTTTEAGANASIFTPALAPPSDVHEPAAQTPPPPQTARSTLIPITGLAPAENPALTLHGNGHTPTLAVYCFGAFKVFLSNQLVTGWNGQKGVSILKYLVGNRERPVAKDILMDIFWPDSGAEVARRNLHQAIYGLRQTLRRTAPDLQLILFENDCYRINPEVDLWMDFEEFERTVRVGRQQVAAGQSTAAMESFALAELLYSGDFFEEELYETWPRAQREYYRSLYLEITAQISAYYIEKRQITPAMVLCQKVLARDRCNERAYRDLILCHLLQGQRQLAIREYQVCVQALKDDLGLPPSEEIQALYRQILAG